MTAVIALVAIPVLFASTGFGLVLVGLVEDIPGRHRAGGAA